MIDFKDFIKYVNIPLWSDADFIVCQSMKHIPQVLKDVNLSYPSLIVYERFVRSSFDDYDILKDVRRHISNEFYVGPLTFVIIDDKPCFVFGYIKKFLDDFKYDGDVDTSLYLTDYKETVQLSEISTLLSKRLKLINDNCKPSRIFIRDYSNNGNPTALMTSKCSDAFMPFPNSWTSIPHKPDDINEFIVSTIKKSSLIHISEYKIVLCLYDSLDEILKCASELSSILPISNILNVFSESGKDYWYFSYSDEYDPYYHHFNIFDIECIADF